MGIGILLMSNSFIVAHQQLTCPQSLREAKVGSMRSRWAWILGGILLAGFVVTMRKALKVKEAEQRPLVMLLIISFVQTVALLVVVPLPFQRYYMPLVPFACIWTAVGVDAFLATIPWRALRHSPGQTHPAAHLPEK